MKHTEIERKWLIDGWPPLEPAEQALVEQGYLCFEPNTVRIRKKMSGGAAGHFLTIKGGGQLVRTEVEFPIEADQYEALRTLLARPPVRKDYRVYALPGGHTLECSLVDEGEPTSFYYAEVEFDSVEASRAFVPPAFLGEEKTEDSTFTMAAYTRRKYGQG